MFATEPGNPGKPEKSTEPKKQYGKPGNSMELKKFLDICLLLMIFIKQLL